MPDTRFFDEAVIHVRGGRGGDGAAHFRREKYVPLGGPDGGDGGRGGDVVLCARPNLHALTQFQFQRHFRAADGARGQKQRRAGAGGGSVVVDVPCGTVVYEAGLGSFVADMVATDDRVVVARGGRGGIGNVHFKSSRFQAPDIATRGDDGEERSLRLELELIADLGLIGAPNAGKSSLLTRISAARPKTAPYPFTTLEPVLGVVTTADSSFVVADLPGLIEGASQGAGLGMQFLRHARRSRVLVHLVDGSGLEHDPLDIFATVNRELNSFDPSLQERPQLVAFNKLDLAEARANWPDFRAVVQSRGFEAIAVSTATGEGLAELTARMLEELAVAPEPKRPEAHFVPVLRPAPVDEEPRLFRRSDGAYVVRDRALETMARSLDFKTPDAAAYFQRQLDRRGVTERLERAGVRDGMAVVIGDFEFEWTPDGL